MGADEDRNDEHVGVALTDVSEWRERAQNPDASTLVYNHSRAEVSVTEIASQSVIVVQAIAGNTCRRIGQRARDEHQGDPQVGQRRDA